MRKSKPTIEKPLREPRFVANAFLLLAATWLAAISASAADGMGSAKANAHATLRDPFWPVGYQPVQRAASVSVVPRNGPTGKVDWNEAMKKIVIGGVSSKADGAFLAVINGEVKSQGDSVTVALDGATYTWRIESIAPPSSVKLLRISVN